MPEKRASESRPNLAIIKGGKFSEFPTPDVSQVIFFPSPETSRERAEWLIGLLEEMQERQETLNAYHEKRRGPPFKNRLDYQIIKLLKEI